MAFAHFVTDARHQMAFAKKVAIFPSTQGSLDDPYFTKQDGNEETRVRVAAAKSIKTAVNYTPVLFSEQMKVELRNAVAKALQGKESPEGSTRQRCQELRPAAERRADRAACRSMTSGPSAMKHPYRAPPRSGVNCPPAPGCSPLPGC